MSKAEQLTPTDILAAASSYLTEGGYRQVEDVALGELPGGNARLFEDVYGIVAVVVYDTWRDLSASWPEAQATLVELISKYVGRGEAKAWDGYLVVFTPSVLSAEARLEAETIRYDTSRVRKLVAAGDQLGTLSDVERALLPLLPLEAYVALEEHESVLERLPELLARRDLPEGAVRSVIQAFAEQLPLVEHIHDDESGK